jgi:phosphohistidine phosphatase
VRLLVVRHAPAGDRAAWSAAGRDDFLRPLTKEGRRKMREAARGLARLVPSPGALATSPLARALETADVLAKAFDVEGPEELESLRPGSSPEEVLPWLRARARVELAAVVGHEPHLGMLVAWLVTGRARPILSFRKGGACLLDLGRRPSPGGAELLWLVPPSSLRRLGR